MTEPTLLILGGDAPRRGRGRPTTFGSKADRRTQIRLTSEQLEDLKSLAAEEKRPLAVVIRDAVNEYVSDSRERQVFERRKAYNPE
jgi:hypothetical protein